MVDSQPAHHFLFLDFIDEHTLISLDKGEATTSKLLSLVMGEYLTNEIKVL